MNILKQRSYQSDLTVDTVFVYLCQQQSWISEVEVAAQLDSPMPVIRKLLVELSDVVESDGDGNWRVVQTVTTEVVSNSSRCLTASQTKELLRLEKTIETSFYLAGLALRQIQSKRLYRENYRTFEAYCRNRFDFTRASAYYLIKAASVVDNLKCQQFVDILPTKESQCRPLMSLPPEKQTQVWLEAISQAKGKVPSARLVKNIVAEIEENHLPRQIGNTSSSQKQEGLNYKPGNNGCEWYVKVEQSTYEQLKNYQEQNGLPTLNSAIFSLLSLLNHQI
ncbi:hypothetical protein Sta7437_4542 (plasmid) [Stanieria cyanosphaera PCC 7437]|uniref:Uncharacterized protein n=1 Tax=Stanieria cyanosphaera (strain ATCC 29371 / PCC 7437) TaxID=111780 RepID=K9Y107_STAC7|nr:hypothetical protein [Stanieria cyanosphaera]AFZ38004.1 hypothetical protein Sta7437_4542 [Stanieria cyanosphaera PCC 7437]